MADDKHPDAEDWAEPVPPGERDLAADLALLVAAAARDADAPLTRDVPESLILPGVPLS